MALSGMFEGSRGRWLCAGLAAGSVVYMLSGKRRPRQDYDTGFDSFLKQEVASDEPQGTNFDCFLKAGPQEQDSTCFESFLKGTNKVAAGAPAGGAPAAKQVSAEELAAKKRVLVMYGTEYGFAKEIAEKLCGQLEALESYW